MNKIHPTAILTGDIQLGENNEILPYTVLIGPLKIGDHNLIGPHAVIGSPGADTRNPRYDSSEKLITLGNNNIIREFTGIEKPCYGEITQLGNNIYLMQSVHISHDAILEDEVVITHMVALGGMARIMKGANLGMGATIHQYAIIGPYSIAATGAAVIKNIKPFSRYIPGKPLSVNQYAIDKFGYAKYSEEIQEYVLRDKLPQSSVLLEIIEPYLEFHAKSKREQY